METSNHTAQDIVGDTEGSLAESGKQKAQNIRYHVEKEDLSLLLQGTVY